MTMKIKNIKGTSENTCHCESWLAHWKKYSNQDVFICQEKSCFNTDDLVGAHVQKGGESKDKTWYIYPLCKKHNSSTEELEVSDECALVPANVSETCGKGK